MVQGKSGQADVGHPEKVEKNCMKQITPTPENFYPGQLPPENSRLGQFPRVLFPPITISTGAIPMQMDGIKPRTIELEKKFAETGKFFYLLFERLVFLGIMGDQIRAPTKPFNTIAL